LKASGLKTRGQAAGYELQVESCGEDRDRNQLAFVVAGVETLLLEAIEVRRPARSPPHVKIKLLLETYSLAGEVRDRVTARALASAGIGTLPSIRICLASKSLP